MNSSTYRATAAIFLRLARLCALITACFLFVSCGGSGGGATTSPPTTTQPSAPPVGNALPGPRPVAEPQSFVSYESGQVRPLALSADGQRLFAANTADNKLEIFTTSGGLTSISSVPVGLEPIAIGVAPDGNVWVVNHLSDSISIVAVDAPVPHVDPALNTPGTGRADFRKVARRRVRMMFSNRIQVLFCDL